MKKTDLSHQLLNSIIKMRPVELIGLARLLGVSIMAAEKEPRNGVDVIKDIIDKFNALSREKKREILQLVKKSNSARGEKLNAGNTKDNKACDDIS